MPKFTQEQINQATAEFFGEQGDAYLEWSLIPGAGNNGPIISYKKEDQNGNDEAPSE